VKNAAPVVEEWLAGHNHTRVGCGDTIRLSGSVSDIESLFNVELEEFKHPWSPLTVIRTKTAALTYPTEIASHVKFVSGLFNFPTVNKVTKTPFRAESKTAVDAAKLKSLYGLGDHVFSGKSNASMAVVEFQGQTILKSDLEQFEKQNNLPNQDIRTCTGGCTGMAGTESSLDAQFIIAGGTGVPFDYHYSEKFDVVAWANWMQSTQGVALVWSVSYGEGINGGIGGTIKASLAQGLNDQFEKLGLLGVSVLIASGDSGVYDRLPWAGWIGDFHPSFPSVLPAVTSVGATQLESDGSETTGVSFSGGHLLSPLKK
jgi:subtilase family serine protease